MEDSVEILNDSSEVNDNASQYILKDETFEIIGACMEVHKELGNGFLEAVYKDALEIEFKLKDIPYQREKAYEIEYKGQKLNRKYIADFIVFDQIVLEVKAQEIIAPVNYAQTINYLTTSKNKIGLLVNFGSSSLQYKRLIK